MPLTPEELGLVARELAASLGGAVVQKAQLAAPMLCYLDLRVPGRTVTVCLCADPALGRLSVVTQRVPSPKQALPFQKWLRQELTGAALQSVETRGRRLTLRFEREGKARALHLSYARGESHLALSGEAERVLAASTPSELPLRPGAPVPPPPAGAEPAREVRLVPSEGAAFPYAAAAEVREGEAQVTRSAEQRRRELLAPLKAQRTRLLRTLAKVEAERDRTPQAEEARRQGELLARNLHRVEKGAVRVTLTDYTPDGPREETVSLDPALAPRAQVERLFHRYRRLLRGVEHATRRFAELDAERAQLDRRVAELEQAEPEALLGSLAERPVSARAGAGPARALPYKEYATTRGERLLVGKGATGNDQLTFKVARPHDTWLHARGVPGAHVVVPLPRGGTLAQEALLDAAHLALHHSDLKGEPRGEVSYTQVKFVRKVKGGAPGQVTYTREKTFLVRVEPTRLERLLKSQVE